MISPAFDYSKLERLLEEANVDLLLAVSKHNVQYLLGGYQNFFFTQSDAIGIGRYQPIVGYCRGELETAFYVGAGNEAWGLEVFPIWIPNVITRSWTSVDSTLDAIHLIRKCGTMPRRIAVEFSFLPADSIDTLRKEFPEATFIEAVMILEELRAVKTNQELEYLKAGAAAITDSMIAAFKQGKPRMTEEELINRVRIEQTNRGLVFYHGLITTGTTLSRAPSKRSWNAGEVLSIDTAGFNHGYLGDMARMAVLGAPTRLMTDLLDEIEHVQQAARKPIAAGRPGGEIFEAGLAAVAECKHRDKMTFQAHGMGLVAHEMPHLTENADHPYPGTHVQRPLEAGMVLSIETSVKHAEVGFVKIEDTVAVTDSGWEGYGDWGRGWNEVQA